MFMYCFITVFTCLYNVVNVFLYCKFNACVHDYDTRIANTQRGNTHVRNLHRHGLATLTRDMGRHASFCVMFIANVPVDALALRIRYGDLYVRHHRSPRLTWRAAMLRHCARNLLTVPGANTSLHTSLNACLTDRIVRSLTNASLPCPLPLPGSTRDIPCAHRPHNGA